MTCRGDGVLASSVPRLYAYGMALPDDSDILELLRSGESERLECKRDNSSPERLRETICAFANDLPNRRLPGVLLVGIADDGTCAGITVSDELLRRLTQMRDSVTPFPEISVRRASLDGCDVAVVEVQPSRNPPVRYNGRVWVRLGPTCRIATPDEERRLTEKRRWSTLPFDAQPVAGTNLSDVDLTRFRLEYLPALVSADTIAQNQRTPEQQLRALRLIDPAGVPTPTALLMLAVSPQSWFPGAVISWRRLGGTRLTDVTLDEKELTGAVPDQLRRIDEIMNAAIAERLIMGPSVHRRRAAYPLAALQQLVRNAVMHRAYDGTASPCRVTWYADRVEVMNPGGPYGAVSPESFGTPGVTDYRKPTLSEALKGYGFVERFGQGLEIVRAALVENGNPPAEFTFPPREAPAFVHVTVRAAS